MTLVRGGSVDGVTLGTDGDFTVVANADTGFAGSRCRATKGRGARDG